MSAHGWSDPGRATSSFAVPRRTVVAVSPIATHGAVRVSLLVRAALWVLVVGNLGRLPGLVSRGRSAPVLLNDVAVVALLGAAALACARGGTLVIDRVAGSGALFAAIGAVGLGLAAPRYALAPNELVLSSAYLARWMAYFGVYVVIVNCVRDRDVPAIVRTLERVVVVFAVFGIVQSAFLPGFAQLVYPESTVYVDWDAQGRRLVSTFLDPNFAGAFIMFGLLLALARLSVGERGLAARVTVLSVALLLTASRSSILATLVGAGIIVAVTGVARRVVRIATGLLVLLLLATPAILEFARGYNKLTIDASALQRLVSWSRALRIFLDNPVIGIGFNTYGFAQRAYGYTPGEGASSFSLDGGLIFVAVLTGVVGLAVFVAMLRRIVLDARAVWRGGAARPDQRAVAIATAAATIALVVHSLFVNSLLLPFLFEPLCVLWGVVQVTRLAAYRAPVAGVVGA